MKVMGALIGGSEEVLALGHQSSVELEDVIRFSRLAGADQTRRYGARGRGGAEAAVNYRVDGGGERCGNDEEQPRAGHRDPGPHAAAAEDFASQQGQCHG